MDFLLRFSLAILAFAVIAKIYLSLTVGWCKSKKCLVGKTVIITGGDSGIGYETALDLAKRGARIILTCRKERQGIEARNRIIEETENKNVHYKVVEFASFDSVRGFAKDINDTEERLDILVNNAGTAGLGDKKSKDGRVIVMQVNYYSMFLLTNLLINLLKKSAPSRVVNVGSLAASYVIGFNVDELDVYYPNHGDYCRSKLCNILFTTELAKKLKGTGITTYSVHPGYANTNIFNSIEIQDYNLLTNPIIKHLYGRTSKEAAQTTLHCSLAKGIEEKSGRLFADCTNFRQFDMMWNDPGLLTKLWERTEEIVNLTSDERQL